jgi:hypothetical protein
MESLNLNFLKQIILTQAILPPKVFFICLLELKFHLYLN